MKFCQLMCSFPDPNPDPDPHVFGPPRCGSISQSYWSGFGSRSVSFYQKPKIVRKTLIPTLLWLLLDFLSLENDVNVPSKSNKQKNVFKKVSFFGIVKVNEKIAGSGSRSISQRHGSAGPDPDPHQNVMDPEHCFGVIHFFWCEFSKKFFC